MLGCFTEDDFGHKFEYSERGDFFPADLHPEMVHLVFVGGGEVRLALVKKTMLTMLSGAGTVEKWMIKGHREYAK